MNDSFRLGLAPSAAFGTSTIERRPVVEDADFDITAMVDLVFMMNIFFLVTWVVAGMEEVDLPLAKNVVASDPTECVLITMSLGHRAHADVFLGEQKKIVDEYRVDESVLQAVEDGVAQGKKIVLIKAERNVPLKDLSSIAAIVSTVEGASLRLAVLEKE